jgi:hypothetical protein
MTADQEILIDLTTPFGEWEDVPAEFHIDFDRVANEGHPDRPSRGSYTEVTYCKLHRVIAGRLILTRERLALMCGEAVIAAAEKRAAEMAEAEANGEFA